MGFGHRAQNGKSSACDAILERCNYSSWKARVYSFSEAILSYCVELEYLPNVTRESMTPEQVALLAKIGKTIRDEKGEDVWVDRLFNLISTDSEKGIDVALIPNIRYASEARRISICGGFNVLCERRNENGSPFISQCRDANHQSETDLWNWNFDFTITHKTGQEAWLRAQAVNLFEFLYERRPKNAVAKGI